ncbi:MAG: signal peptide peptidase SppA [Clostridia bacterium]|nr:signal peptide peptidase SppA [Deltaproteobacteria bacterium]
MRFDVVAIGRYKTAPDALTMSGPKPEEDEVRGDLLAEADKLLMHALTVDRRLSAADATKVVALGGMRAGEAQQHGLVDEIAELDIAQPDTRRAHTADDLLDKPRTTWGTPNTVAIVPVVGTIVRDDGDNPLPGESASAKRIVKELEDAGNDPSVIGVVLRVDSGGGEVFASELIHRAVKAVQRKKPIVASMADTAASGGYYIVAPCDAIYAEPNTVTGSIGIFQLKVDLAGFFDLTEIKAYTYKTGPLADWRATTHGFTDDERARLNQILSEEYDAFLAKVAEGRHMTVDAVRSIAEGHVYTGRRAKELGLVDELGGLADAVEAVKARARVQGEVALQVPKTVFSLSKAVLGGASAAVNPLEHITALKGRLMRWEREPLALLPQTFEVRP